MGISYTTSDFRKGLKVLIEGEPHLMIESEFMKPGKGQAVYRTKLRNLLRGNVLDKTYRSGDRVEGADVTESSLQYLYNDSTHWHFMDDDSYEQYAIEKEKLGDAYRFLKENEKVDVVFWNEQPISVVPPNHVELKVTYCEPGAKGNTATNVTKPATVETDAEIQVPIFVNIGDVIRVDTRTGEYIGRKSTG